MHFEWQELIQVSGLMQICTSKQLKAPWTKTTMKWNAC